MALFPEREPRIKSVEENPEASPLSIEHKEVVTPVPTQFTGQVNNDQGKPLLTAVKPPTIAIELPEPMETLQKKSQGDIGSALTWWAAFWIRLFKQYVFRNSTNS